VRGVEGWAIGSSEAFSPGHVEEEIEKATGIPASFLRFGEERQIAKENGEA
jgi:hypothetical protein